MKQKRVHAVSAVLLMAILLAGCHKGQETGALQLREANQDKIVLTLFLPIDTNSLSVEIYKDIIADYNNKNERVEIRADGIPTAEGFNEALMQRLENGGAGADLFMVNADSVKPLYTKGYFCDLSEFSVFNMLTETAKEQSVVDGTVYTIPMKMTAYGIYVNVELLDSFGLRPPGNIEEFKTCCQSLLDNGVTPLSLNRWYAMNTFVMARGLYPVYQSENKEELIEGLNDGSIHIGDYMLEGFRLFDKMVKDGYYGDNITARYTDQIKAGSTDLEDFAAGKTAFAVFPLGSEGMIEDAAPDMEFVLQGFPVLPDGTISLPALAGRLCVNARGENVQEALDALEYITLAESERFKNDENGYLPAVQSNDNFVIDPRISPIYEDVISSGQIPIEDMSLHFTYWDTTRILCLEIMDGMSPEEAAEEYNRIQKEQISAYEAP